MPLLAHILIGDSDPDIAYSRAESLTAAGYRAMQVSDPSSLLGLASSRRPDAIILGSFNGAPDAIDIAAALKDADATAHIPIILIGGSRDTETRKRALDAKIDDILPSDVEPIEILFRLPRLVRSSIMLAELSRRVETAKSFNVSVDPRTFKRGYPDRPRILAVAENGTALNTLQRTLDKEGFDAVPERSAFRAGDRLDDERFDATVVQVSPDDDLDRVVHLCAHIRNNPRLFNQPTLVRAPTSAFPDGLTLYRGGAGIAMLGNADEGLMTTYTHMLVARQRLRWTLRDPFKATLAEGTKDTLGGIYSREFFDSHLARVVEATQARSANLSLAVIRVGNFGGLNEEFGDEATDILMRQLSNWISGMTRIEDTVARLGTADFAMIMTETPEAEAIRVVQRIAGILEQSDFHMTEEVMRAVRVWIQTGTVGIAEGDTAESLLSRACAEVF